MKYNLLLFLFIGSILAQDEVVMLSHKVGTEIDVHENLFYRIFPKERQFINAQIIQLSKNKFEIRIINSIKDGKVKENKRYINLKEFATLQNHVNGQPIFTEEKKIAMYEGMDYLKGEKIINDIPKPQYVKIQYTGNRKLKGTLTKVEDKILFIQTPTTLETVDLSEIEEISYRMMIEDFTYLKPYLFGISGLIGLGMAQIYNSQRSTIYNEYGIARTDLNRYTQLYGIVIGLIFSSELFDAVSTFLTPSETFILSKETYDAQL